MRLAEIFTDPSTGQLSCSRTCLFVLVVFVLPGGLLLEAFIRPLGGAWNCLSAVVASLATIYAVNSGARVWKETQPVQSEKNTGGSDMLGFIAGLVVGVLATLFAIYAGGALLSAIGRFFGR